MEAGTPSWHRHKSGPHSFRHWASPSPTLLCRPCPLLRVAPPFARNTTSPVQGPEHFKPADKIPIYTQASGGHQDSFSDFEESVPAKSEGLVTLHKPLRSGTNLELLSNRLTLQTLPVHVTTRWHVCQRQTPRTVVNITQEANANVSTARAI